MKETCFEGFGPERFTSCPESASAIELEGGM